MACAKKPNFLMLRGDDLGIWNISHFIRWLGRIEAGSVLNGIVSQIDVLADQIMDFPEQLSNPPA